MSKDNNDFMSKLLATSKIPETMTVPVIAGAGAAIIGANIAYRAAKSFQRDAQGSTFSDLVQSVNILSNKDSVLQREKVKESMDDYDKLFSGARKDVGSLHQDESIKTRQKEYKTMVNNFYDLVTDFYEWGWGQVRFQTPVSRFFASTLFAHLAGLAFSPSTLLPGSREKLSSNPSSVLSTIWLSDLV